MEGSDVKNIPKISEKYNFDLALLNSKYPLTILTRVTIDTNEDVLDTTLKQLREKFDLIAMRTSSAHILKEACCSYDIDVISPSCNERLSFEFDPVDLKKAIDRNVYFELCYANAIRDLQARTYTTQIAKQLFEYIKGDKCIISSEAEVVSELRFPGDIFYFAKSLGLPNDKAKFTTQKNCEQLIHLARNKKK
ncbi:unnamed protein product [Mucor hiemalis]